MDQTTRAKYTATLLRMSSAIENAPYLIDDATNDRRNAPTGALGSSSSGSGSGSSVHPNRARRQRSEDTHTTSR